MKLIVGLGNPGEKYKKTRHNVGFSILEKWKVERGKWKVDKGSNSRLLTLPSSPDLAQTDNSQLILAKAQTFMNESGKAVKALVKKYRAKLSDLLVIHDDLDIAFGSFKLQFGKGPRQHNGVTSIENYLGSKEFWRLRVGIESRSKIKDQRSKLTGEDYVLGKFTAEELKSLNILIESELISIVKKWVVS